MEVKNIISSGLLELYISGLTTPEETAQVDEWVILYPEVKLELTSIQDAMESYAQEHAIVPDPSIKNKILARIAKNAELNSSTDSDNKTNSSSNHVNPGVVTPIADVTGNKFPAFQDEKSKAAGQSKVVPLYYKYAAAASIILLLISAVVGYNFYNKYTETNGRLQVAEQKLQQEIQLSQAMHTDMDVMTNKYAQPVLLNGTPHAPEAAAKIYWMKDKGGDVFVDPTNLPNLPEGKQYQLWGMVDGKPVDGGVISVSKGIYHIQKMKSFGSVQAFAITMEKAGGSPTPDMNAMVVISKI